MKLIWINDVFGKSADIIYTLTTMNYFFLIIFLAYIEYIILQYIKGYVLGERIL